MRRRFFSNKISEKIDLSKNYFKIEALEDGLTAKLILTECECEYCVNNGAWTRLSANTSTVSINKEDTLYFRGNLTPTSSSDGFGIGTFTISKKYNVKGNIMSLLYGDDFEGQTDLVGKDYAFYKLFYNCTNIVNASELILPATTLAKDCYSLMFRGCTGLTTAPELPATTLAESCYQNMFYGCTSLTEAPELPATTLANYCYTSMFYGCTGLTTAPELPATTLALSCYYYMFYGCTGLTTAPELPATTLADYCYYYMFRGCSKLNYIKMLATDVSARNCLSNWVSGVASSGTFIKHPNMTTLSSGESGIPEGWTVEDYVDNSSNLITFTIDGTEYQAEEGMTWGEWVESEYNNTDKYFISYGFVKINISAGSTGFIGIESPISSSDAITPDNNYIILYLEGGGSND